MTIPKNKSFINAIAASNHASGFFNACIHAGIAGWKISKKRRRKLHAVMGKKRKTTKPTLADFEARRKLSRLLINAMNRHWKEHREEYHYLHITIIDSIGNTTDRRPEVALEAFKAKCRKAIVALDVKAVGMIECQGIMNYPGEGLGRTLMHHGHFIGFANDISGIDDAVTALNESSAWSTTFGVDPIHVRVLPDKPGEVAWIVHYLSKLPHDAKNLMANQKKPGKMLMMNTTAGYRPEFALRIFEGLSQTLITDALFYVGAKDVLNPIRKKLNAWHKKRKGPAFRNKAIAKMWRDLRRIPKNGSRYYLPYRFLTGSERPTRVDKPVVVERKIRRANGGMRTAKLTIRQLLKGRDLDDL